MAEKTPPLLPRDANGGIDRLEADRIQKELLAKLATETRLHEKDQSLHMARTGKRDVVVHLAVTVLPSINGHKVIGEREREYNQWCVRLNANILPVRNVTANKALAELCHIGKQALMRLGMVIE